VCALHLFVYPGIYINGPLSISIVHFIGKKKRKGIVGEEKTKEQEMRKRVYNRKRIKVNNRMEIPSFTELS